MLVKPNINEADIIACLLSFYDIEANKLEFLPLGADLATAVYRIDTENKNTYFVKLRTGNFQEISIRLLDFFHQSGIKHIISPLKTKTGETWVTQDKFVLTVFPFVVGVNGVEKPLTTQQFRELGSTLQQIHLLHLPANLQKTMRQEDFSLSFTIKLASFLKKLGQTPQNRIVSELLLFLEENKMILEQMLSRTRQLRETIMTTSAKSVICHADMHSYNMLLTANDQFFIIDWDEALLAPKERDLMFIGSGIGGDASGTIDQQTVFYTGYQPESICWKTMAYYRYVRIIEDISIYCEEIWQGELAEQDLELSFLHLKSNFNSNDTIDRANKAFAQIDL